MVPDAPLLQLAKRRDGQAVGLDVALAGFPSSLPGITALSSTAGAMADCMQRGTDLSGRTPGRLCHVWPCAGRQRQWPRRPAGPARPRRELSVKFHMNHTPLAIDRTVSVAEPRTPVSAMTMAVVVAEGTPSPAPAAYVVINGPVSRETWPPCDMARPGCRVDTVLGDWQSQASRACACDTWQRAPGFA